MIEKALSVRQPWAWLIVNGYKDIENRTWWTKERTMIYVHAPQKIDLDACQWVRENFPDIPLPANDEFITSAIVGTVQIIDCVTFHPSKWFFGKYGFVLHGAKPCEPIPCTGRLGFFKPEIEKGL